MLQLSVEAASACVFHPISSVTPNLTALLPLYFHFSLQVRDHFENNEEAKALLKQVKSFKVTK